MAWFMATLSIGYPMAKRQLDFEILDEDLAKVPDDKRDEYIQQEGWEYACQFVECYTEPKE